MGAREDRVERLARYLSRMSAMKTEAELPKGVYVKIRSYPTSAAIKFADVNGRALYVDPMGGVTTKPTDLFLGEMYIAKVKGQDFWNVTYVEAKRGFGPLLYDVAMEYATLHGSGLASDREGPVSVSAHDVWEKYYQTRSDVEWNPLPSKFHREMDDHPTSFAYTKDPHRIERLRGMGRLIEQ